MERILRYPATIAGLVGLVGIVVAAALFLSAEGAQAERFSTIVGLASLGVIALANNLRTDSATNEAKEAKEAVQSAVAEGAGTTPAALSALTEILKRTERKVETVAEAVNGPMHEEREAASAERTRVQERDLNA